MTRLIRGTVDDLLKEEDALASFKVVVGLNTHYDLAWKWEVEAAEVKRCCVLEGYC